MTLCGQKAKLFNIVNCGPTFPNLIISLLCIFQFNYTVKSVVQSAKTCSIPLSAVGTVSIWGGKLRGEGKVKGVRPIGLEIRTWFGKELALQVCQVVRQVDLGGQWRSQLYTPVVTITSKGVMDTTHHESTHLLDQSVNFISRITSAFSILLFPIIPKTN